MKIPYMIKQKQVTNSLVSVVSVAIVGFKTGILKNQLTKELISVQNT